MSLTRTSYMRRGAALKRSRERMRRDLHKRLGTAKAVEGSWRDLAQKLESLRAKEVKMRDGWRCRQCAFDGVPTHGPVDAGHIYPKGKFPSGKFLVENIVAQCRRHNQIHIRQPAMMFTWYQREYGPAALEELHALVLSMPRRPSMEWMKEAIEESERAIAEMEPLAVA